MGSEMSEDAERKRAGETKEAFTNSDFYKGTKNAAGLSKPKFGTSKSENLVNTLRSREIGKCSPYSNMSSGNKCKVSNRFFPNHYVDIDEYDGKVFCGIFNRDGSLYLTASQDRYLRLYKSDDSSYKLLKTFPATDVGWSIIDVAFSPDQKSFAYTTWSSYIYLCPIDGDMENIDALPLIEHGRRFCVFSMAFSGDSREVLAAANDGSMYVYDRQSGCKAAKVRAHYFDVNCVTYADETSNIIYSAGDDGLIKVWDRRTLREYPSSGVGVLAGHGDGITYLDSKGDSRYLISNSKDQTIKLWDIRRFTKEEDANGAMTIVSKMNWDYRWQDVPKTLKNSNQMNIPGDTSVMTYRGHNILKTLIRCRFSPLRTTGQQFIYTGCGSGDIVVYDALTGEMVCSFRAHKQCVRDIDMHPDRMEMMSTSWDNCIKKWTYFCMSEEEEIKSGDNEWRKYGWNSEFRNRDHFLWDRRRVHVH